MSPVTAPETAVRERIISTLNTEFTGEVTFASDKIHDSLGTEGAVGGVYPGATDEQAGRGVVASTTVYVQLFRPWTPQVDPKQAVDPQEIEEDGERIRRALLKDDVTFPGDAHLWFYRVVRIDFPDDPAGNKTRLVATVLAKSQNAGIVETSG